MKIIVISNYDVVREGIVSILSKHRNISVVFVSEGIEKAVFMIKSSMAEVVLLDLDSKEGLTLIKDISALGTKVKLIILDFYGNNELFINALKYGVQGYILGKASEEEIMYAIDQIDRGKKYFDSYFMDYLINESANLPNGLELLTVREKQILIEIAKGGSNRKISEKFFISENTVKKHISHIFEKLNIRDRTEAALYVSKYKMV